LPITNQQPCRICQTGQRLSTVAFGIFALGLAVVASDPAEGPLRQALLMTCAGLSGLAVFRFPIARLVSWHLARRKKRRIQQMRTLTS